MNDVIRYINTFN